MNREHLNVRTIAEREPIGDRVFNSLEWVALPSRAYPVWLNNSKVVHYGTVGATYINSNSNELTEECIWYLTAPNGDFYAVVESVTDDGLIMREIALIESRNSYKVKYMPNDIFNGDANEVEYYPDAPIQLIKQAGKYEKKGFKVADQDNELVLVKNDGYTTIEISGIGTKKKYCSIYIFSFRKYVGGIHLIPQVDARLERWIDKALLYGQLLEWDYNIDEVMEAYRMLEDNPSEENRAIFEWRLDWYNDFKNKMLSEAKRLGYII